MPATGADLPIDQLLASRPDLWRGRRRPIIPVLGSGRADLDDWLPTGGWPCGRLVELLPERFGLGELDMLLPALAEQTRQGLPVLFASPPLVPCPQYLAQAGLALERLIIVRKTDQALWAAEQGLKSGLCGAIVLWHPPGRVQPRAIRRLQLAAENGSAPVFVCYRSGQQPPPSLSALRVQIRPGPELIMLRGDYHDDCRDRHRLHLGRGNVIAFRPKTGKDRQ
jgi:protein ImuA